MSKRGPKTERPDLETRPVTLLLDESTIRMLKALGGPNGMSRAVRQAARLAYDTEQREALRKAQRETRGA